MFTFCSKDPTCDVCKRTKSTRARCKTESKKFMDDAARSTKFGDLITADHKILNV